jgi:KUP system potassium uptake protein
VELAFCTANMLKVLRGGWVPLVIGGIIFTLMSTWKTGRQLLGQRLRASSLPLSDFLQDVAIHPPQRVKGTAIFLSGNIEGTPIALLHNLKHNKVLHQRVIILNMSTADVPHVNPCNRVQIEKLEANFFRVIGKFGFMEDPNVPDITEECARKNFPIDDLDTTFFLSRETVIPSPRKGMALWRERLFSVMTRNAQSATAFFRIPPNRVVELGMQVEM